MGASYGVHVVHLVATRLVQKFPRLPKKSPDYPFSGNAQFDGRIIPSEAIFFCYKFVSKDT